MAMYDVGMASMAAMFDEALAVPADVLNSITSRPHCAAGRYVRQRIATHLWDAQSGTYVNKWATARSTGAPRQRPSTPMAGGDGRAL